MCRLRLVGLVAAALLLAAGTASANTIDPQIIIRGGSGTTIFLSPGATAMITFGPSQVFPGPGGCTSFTPASSSLDGFDHLVCGVVWSAAATTSLPGITFAISPAFQLPLTLVCSFCTGISASPDGSLVTFMFPVGMFNPGDDFEIELVGLSLQSTVGITPVPEPGTLALLGTGLGALGLFRRRRKHPLPE